MRTRKPWRFGLILLAAPLLLAITSEGGYPQAPLSIPAIAPPPPSLPQTTSHVVRSPVPHQLEVSVEQLLDQITAIRAQKAELEKREQALVNTLRMKLAAQQDRLTKLGIAEKTPALRTQAEDLPLPVLPSK